MTFERSRLLFLLPIPFLWIAWEWRRHLRHTALILKALMICAVILALSEPALQFAIERSRWPPCWIHRPA